ncbi:MAG: 3-dehydroquinate synthase [Chlamydiales bacterium]
MKITQKSWRQLCLDEGQNIAVVTDKNLASLGKIVAASLCGTLFLVPPGEEAKSREQKAQLEDALFAALMGRDTLIVALGGGVVTDLAGFVASTFCRGVPYISIPTTLMGMVDAAIGGKVGVNTPFGKNLVGAFYPPQEVVIDIDLLTTLSEKEMQNGWAEVLKYGFIADPSLLEETNLSTVIEKCIAIKLEIVSQDPFEKGRRKILNFGHTIGHALEKTQNFQISHGEAIATGMRIAADISHHMGLLSTACLKAVNHYLEPFSPLSYNPHFVEEALLHDKKKRGGIPHFVLLDKIGKPHQFAGEYTRTIDPTLLRERLHAHAH